MKIIKPKDPESKAQAQVSIRKRYAAMVGCGCAVLLLVAAIAIPDGAGIPRALADPTMGSSEIYVPDMMQDEPDYGTYTPGDKFGGADYPGGQDADANAYTSTTPLIVDVQGNIPAGRLVTDAEDKEAEYTALTAPDDAGIDDTLVTDAGQDRVQQQPNGGYMPSTGTAGTTIDQLPKTPEYDGEIAALRQEVAALREMIDGKGTNNGTATSESEVDALRAEIARLQAQLAEQEKAKTETKPAETGTTGTDDKSADTSDIGDEPTLPPDWLIPNTNGNTGGDDNGVPEWLYGTFLTAVMNNPYDGGPLCKASYAKVPAANYGMRVRCELDIPCSKLTQGDLLAFVQRVVLTTDADWVTVIGSDGKGIQFTGGDSDGAYYGPLDEYGRVTDPEYYLGLTSKGYTYERVSSGAAAARSLEIMPLTNASRDILMSAATGKHYVRIFPGLALKDLTQTDLRQAVLDVAGIDDCEWVLIAGIDGYGLQFYAGDTDIGYYGVIDDNGNVHTVDYVIQWNGTAYTWVEPVG